MDYSDYPEDNLRQLSDQEYYQVIPFNPTKHLVNLIKITVQEAENLGYINNSEAKFLTNMSPRMPVFYTLPMIHKQAAFPPGRPIISTCGATLEPVAQFVDSFFQPFVPETKSYIKDTTDFILKMEGFPIPENVVLLIMDIFIHKCPT